jgi:hypothetical protein
VRPAANALVQTHANATTMLADRAEKRPMDTSIEDGS